DRGRVRDERNAPPVARERRDGPPGRRRRLRNGAPVGVAVPLRGRKPVGDPSRPSPSSSARAERRKSAVASTSSAVGRTPRLAQPGLQAAGCAEKRGSPGEPDVAVERAQFVVLLVMCAASPDNNDRKIPVPHPRGRVLRPPLLLPADGGSADRLP